jgi:hypothetical protein
MDVMRYFALNGHNILFEENRVEAREAELIIKNTYRTLITRGKNVSYEYFTDKAVEGHFRDRLMGHEGLGLFTKVAELDMTNSAKPSGRDL